MGRHMTGSDLDLIEKIIRQFKAKPTWGALHERTQNAGLPFSQVTLTRNKDIIAMMKDQQEAFKQRKAKVLKGLPRRDPKITTRIEDLEAENAELKEELKRLHLTINRFVGNAAKLGISSQDLDRPLAIRRGKV